MKTYYAIKLVNDEPGNIWYTSHARGGCLQTLSAALPSTVYEREEDAKEYLERFRKDFPKYAEGAKIVRIAVFPEEF